MVNYQAKSKGTFVLLGVLLGALGIHNFYAGRTKQGIIQLLITLVSCGTLWLAVWIWAVVDVFTVEADGNGVPMV